jgi:hypothetical protein
MVDKPPRRPPHKSEMIPWNGGDCPYKEKVHLVMGHHYDTYCVAQGSAQSWVHLGGESDITHYMPTRWWDGGYTGGRFTGECPEHLVGKVIKVIFRDGGVCYYDRAEYCDWEITGDYGDVIAYYIPEDTPTVTLSSHTESDIDGLKLYNKYGQVTTSISIITLFHDLLELDTKLLKAKKECDEIEAERDGCIQRINALLPKGYKVAGDLEDNNE